MTDLETLIDRIVKQGGFISPAELNELGTLDRLRMVLVRFHQGRFLIASQSCADAIEAIEKGGWYCRDVSLPTTDPAYERHLKRMARPVPMRHDRAEHPGLAPNVHMNGQPAASGGG
jgi:hypothetical protein